MKNITTYIITGLSLLLAVAIVTICVLWNKKCPPAITGKVSIPSMRTPHTSYKDSSGRQHVVLDKTAQDEIQSQAVETGKKILAQQLIDSMAIYQAVKAKQIEGVMVVNTYASRDSIKFLTRRIDSLQRQVFAYQDKYLKVIMRAPSPGNTRDSGDFDFAYNADLRFVDYHKRDKVLGLSVGKKRYYTDISSSDPRMTIKGVDRFTIQRRVPQLGFRIQALASYNFETRGYSAGAGVRFDAGDRFNAGLNYTYNFGLNKWVPITFVKYDILQFGR